MASQNGFPDGFMNGASNEDGFEDSGSVAPGPWREAAPVPAHPRFTAMHGYAVRGYPLIEGQAGLLMCVHHTSLSFCTMKLHHSFSVLTLAVSVHACVCGCVHDDHDFVDHFKK